MPVRLTASSWMRRRRVMSRGEFGGRLKPRSFRLRARVSMRTEPFGERCASSRTMSTSSSSGAVWAGPSAAAGAGAW